jgi:hypothetical protein
MTRYSRGAAASAADILVSFEPEPAAEVRGAVLAGLRAHNRGVLRVYLDTLDFQARPFYEREGYVVFGVQEDYRRGISGSICGRSWGAGAAGGEVLVEGGDAVIKVLKEGRYAYRPSTRASVSH